MCRAFVPIAGRFEQEGSLVKQASRMFSAAGLAVLTLVTLLLLTPAAAAATAGRMGLVGLPNTPSAGGGEPMALATTGLDITVPIIIVLSTLVLGIALVAWAFLRTGSGQRHR